MTRRLPQARDAASLALGTLTVWPVTAPAQVNRAVAGWAMVLAPLVGAVLAAVCGVLLWLLGGGPEAAPSLPALLLDDPRWAVATHPFLAAAMVVGTLAVLTRALHLDGLADTADGLGSGRPPGQALEIMRRGDVGPFGVVTLVVALLLQVFALGVLVRGQIGVAGLFLALVVSRLVLPALCLRGVPAARSDGLGRTVAGSVGPAQLVLSALLGVALLLPLTLVAPGTYALWGDGALRAGLVAVLALGAAGWLARHAVRRLGGVTGDVLGAAVETAFTVTLVLLTLAT